MNQAVLTAGCNRRCYQIASGFGQAAIVAGNGVKALYCPANWRGRQGFVKYLCLVRGG